MSLVAELNPRQNRDIVPLRAALNMALELGDVLSARAWQSVLRPYEAAGTSRDLYLDRGQRRALIAALAPNAAAFVRGLCALPLRPGALAALTSGDFDVRRAQLTISRDKSGRARKILLPPLIAALLKEQTKSKLPSARLFTRADGSAWNKDNWNDPIKAAIAIAELPSATSAYTLRHSTITDLVTGGLDLLTIAQLAGTGVAMIESHYAHLQHERARDALAGLAL